MTPSLEITKLMTPSHQTESDTSHGEKIPLQADGAPLWGSPADGAKYLFIDAQHVERLEEVQRIFHQPVKEAGPVIVPDRVWEHDMIMHRDAPIWSPERGCWQFWYYGGDEMLPLLAESSDGKNWDKPSLNLVEWQQSRENNIVDLGFKPAHVKEKHLVVLRDDRDPDPARRYKALADVPAQKGLRTLISADSLTWAILPTDIIPSGDQYRLNYDALQNRFVASAKEHMPGHKRAVALSFSEDFATWSTPRLTFWADETDQEIGRRRIEEWLGDADRRQPVFVNAQEYSTDVYNMPFFTYADLYLGLPVMFHQSGKRPLRNEDGILYPMLTSSRDLENWDRLEREAFIFPSRLSDPHNWDYAMLHASTPIRIGEELYFYYTGARFTHLGRTTLEMAGLIKPVSESELEPMRAIFLARLRLDGFASLHACEQTGMVVTKPVQVNGPHLFVNADAGSGELRVEVRDAATNQPLPGYSFADCRALQNDATRHVVGWQAKQDVSELQGREIRLAFSLRNTHLYSFWFDAEK